MLNPYFRCLDLIGLASTAALLFAEEVITADQFEPMFHASNSLCLLLPYLADSVEKWPALLDWGRCFIRLVVTGE